MIRELLRRGDFKAIGRPSSAMAFLYDPDEFYRFRAAEALGYLCKGKKAREFILRLFWHLSDESGAYCVGAPLGIAEIGRNNPDVFDGFKNKFVSLLDDWEVERRYVAYGIGRTAEIVKDAYPDPKEKLLEKIEEIGDGDFVVYAVWALGMLGETEVIRTFVNDERRGMFYDGEKITVRSVWEIARMFI